MNESKTITLAISCPLKTAYAFLAAPENFPQWASGLCSAIEKKGNDWIAKTPMGSLKVLFTQPNEFGVLDHAIILSPKKTVYVPMRIVQNGAGSEVMLTLFRDPEMPVSRFLEDAGWVERDLEALKDLLEGNIHAGEENVHA